MKKSIVSSLNSGKEQIKMKDKKSVQKKSRNDKEIRLENHFRRLGTRNPKCAGCEETEPAALTGCVPNIICYECLSKSAKKSMTEFHHFAGRNNDSFTVPIPGNDHRILSERQRDWPQNTLRNPNGSPLLKASGSLRGLLETLR